MKRIVKGLQAKPNQVTKSYFVADFLLNDVLKDHQPIHVISLRLNNKRYGLAAFCIKYNSFVLVNFDQLYSEREPDHRISPRW